MYYLTACISGWMLSCSFKFVRRASSECLSVSQQQIAHSDWLTVLRQEEISADSRCRYPLLSRKCLLLLPSSIFIFPRVAALTFSTEKLTVFRDSRGSAVLLCPVRKRCHERKVMSVPPGCLLNLRRHYFATQHDCIHIIPHPAKVTGAPPAWRPCALGFNQRDRDPSALMDVQIKLGAQ